MAEDVDYFIPPEIGEASVLARYLTPLPANACEAFVRAYVSAGGLVWDPFGRTDTVGRIAARLGRRAVLSDFNPLIAFTLRATLHSLSPRELDRALGHLAAAPKQQTTLEVHVNSLYATTCPVCQSPAIARAFIWNREENRPVEKEFHCTGCNQLRRTAVEETDLVVLSKIEERGLTYYSLLERMGASEGPLRPLGEHLLGLYTPRNLYALASIQSKIGVTVASGPAQDALSLALLEAMEAGTTLHPASLLTAEEKQAAESAESDRRTARPASREDRGARLRTVPRSAGRPPDVFLEVNCWAAFAEACSAQRARLEREAGDAPYLRTTPPPVAVHRGSARRVAEEIAEQSVDLILAAPPLIDVGDTLSLSFLWTAWLLGKDEARAFSPEYLLRPKRPDDWGWFLTAMVKSCRALCKVLVPGGKMILCFPAAGLTYINVLLLAAAGAGLQLEHVSYQPFSPESLRRPQAFGGIAGYYYLRFCKRQPAGPAVSEESAEDVAAGAGEAAPPPASVPQPGPVPLASGAQQDAGGVPTLADDLVARTREAALPAAVDIVQRRGEPSPYVWLHLAMVVRLAQTGLLAEIAHWARPGSSPWEILRRSLTEALERAEGRQLMLLEPAPTQGPARSEEEAADDEPAVQRPWTRRGWWWLADLGNAESPLRDRVEWAVYTVLSTTSLPTTNAIIRVVHALFPGLLTPDPGLLDLCLQSYATRSSPVHWQLRPQDALQRRSEDHAEMLALLAALGHRLGFQVCINVTELRRKMGRQSLADLLSPAELRVEVEHLLPWHDPEGHPVHLVWYRGRVPSHLFAVQWTAMLGESVLRGGNGAQGIARFLVVPPERADLLVAKKDTHPLLQIRLGESGWQFLRFDALRNLASRSAPTLDDVQRIAGLRAPADRQGLQLKLL